MVMVGMYSISISLLTPVIETKKEIYEVS